MQKRSQERRRREGTRNVMLANSFEGKQRTREQEKISMTIIMIMRVVKECRERKILMKMSVNDSGECTK